MVVLDLLTVLLLIGLWFGNFGFWVTGFGLVFGVVVLQVFWIVAWSLG